ncbi:MAG: DNA gyrase C-terminal beta-propeller domain-containing protein, partial [Oscillospiraceae bacterium]
GVRAVDDADDAIIISQSGIIIRVHIEDIATQSRYGGGVRVMRVGGDDRVVTLARAERSEDEETVKPEMPEDAELLDEDILEEELFEEEQAEETAADGDIGDESEEIEDIEDTEVDEDSKDE